MPSASSCRTPIAKRVYLRELLSVKDESVAKLPLCLGKNIGGESIIIDLARTPHMLIAGTTGSGKSVAINTMILSLVYRLRPDQCRLIMVDPKMLELSVYDGIPHLLTPVVTDPKKAVVALKWAVREMEERYKKMAKLGVRNIDGYNARLLEAKSKGEELSRTVHTGFDKETGKAIYEEEKLDLDPLPYIVIIVDEMADLMMVAARTSKAPCSGWRRWPVPPACTSFSPPSGHRSTSSPAPSRRTSRPASRFRSPRKSTAAPSSAKWAPSSCLGKAICSIWRAAVASAACTGRSFRTKKSRRWCAISKRRASRNISKRSPRKEPADEDGAVFDATGMGSDGGGDLFSQAVAIVKRDRKASTSYIHAGCRSAITALRR